MSQNLKVIKEKERRLNKQHSTNAIKRFEALQRIQIETPKSNSIMDKLKQLSVLPNKMLQRKLDYYITPYNTGLIYK